MWYHLYNFKNVKNTDGGVLLLVNFTKSNTLSWVFFTAFKLYYWYKNAQRTTFMNQTLTQLVPMHPFSIITCMKP